MGALSQIVVIWALQALLANQPTVYKSLMFKNCDFRTDVLEKLYTFSTSETNGMLLSSMVYLAQREHTVQGVCQKIKWLKNLLQRWNLHISSVYCDVLNVGAELPCF